MKQFAIFVLLSIICACSPQSVKVNMKQIDAEEYIRKYYPDVNEKMLAQWKNSKAIEIW